MDGLSIQSDPLSSRARLDRGSHAFSRFKRFAKGRLSFVIVVLLPVLLATIYFYGIATPQYVSEAQFVVRGQGASSPSMLSSLLQGAGGAGSATEDTYAVQAYMMSRDAARDLIETQKLRAVFDAPGADLLARFPSPFTGRSFEQFFEYYQGHVVADLDSTTGISTLTVRTFRAADSRRIGAALLADAEQLVNRMNARQRANTMKSSMDEYLSAQKELAEIETKIALYRNREGIIDPLKQSVTMLQDVNALQNALVNTQLQLEQVEKATPNSPMIQVYRRRMAALQAQIATAKATITGPENSLVPKLTDYDGLVVQRELAEKELASSRLALDEARMQADRQLLYLNEIVAPDLPDYPKYPRSLASIAVVFASFLGIFLMGKLIVAGVREHQGH